MDDWSSVVDEELRAKRKVLEQRIQDGKDRERHRQWWAAREALTTQVKQMIKEATA